MNPNLNILVVDDDHSSAKTLSAIFQATGYRAEVAQSGAEALDKVENAPFDCVLSDIRMPGIHGIELYRTIKARQPGLPVVLMTAYASHRLVQEGLQEGAIAALTKPLDIGLLLRFFAYLRGERAVVIVDDDPAFCQTVENLLRARGFVTRSIADSHQAVENLGPDTGLVLLDMKLGELTGLKVLREIRSRHPRLPVVLVTSCRDEMVQAIQEALETGAYACLYKPFEMEELLQVMTEIREEGLRSLLKQPPTEKVAG